MLEPGTILQNRYRVVRQLGRGGMGTVYEAVDQRLNAPVALKETHAAGERLLRQFEREAQLLARLQHPALPRVSDHFAEGTGQFLVMQFVAGEDLGEMLRRRRAGLPVGEALRWGDELLDALEYLHGQEPPVIHRDIKPQNLKLSDRGRIILLDFGLAKGLPGGEAQTTAPQSVLGYTPSYAPLEQIHGEGTDARSDLYSLGATLYHLLTGAAPPGALKRVAAVADGDADPLVPAHEVNAQVPAEVSHVLNRALAIARQRRFADAAEMRRAWRDAADAARADGGEARTVLLPPGADPAQLDATTKISTAAAPSLTSPDGAVKATAATADRRTRDRRLWLAGLAALPLAAGLLAYWFAAGTRGAGAGRDAAGGGDAARQTKQAESEFEKRAAAGRQLFQEMNCVKCHGDKGEGKIGPALAGLLGEEVRLNNEVTTIADESYIRESILAPNARVVAGYKPIMPSFRRELSDEQVSQLVAYITQLDTPPAANKGP